MYTSVFGRTLRGLTDRGMPTEYAAVLRAHCLCGPDCTPWSSAVHNGRLTGGLQSFQHARASGALYRGLTARLAFGCLRIADWPGRMPKTKTNMATLRRQEMFCFQNFAFLIFCQIILKLKRVSWPYRCRLSLRSYFMRFDLSSEQ